MKKKRRPRRLIVLGLLCLLLYAGCYWTADRDEGGLVLEIDVGELGVSQLESYSGLFYGWVVADDLMRGDEAAANRAFAEVEAALDEAIVELEATEDLSSFAVDLAFPSIQVQASFFAGSSGSNTFAGLRAESVYLVVVETYDFATETEGIGFATATVSAGETKSVSIEVGKNWASFYQFLETRYGLSFGPAAIAIVDGAGYFSEFGPLYVDLLSGESPDPGFSFSSWYPTVDVLDTEGNVIQKSGNRPGIPTDTATYLINGIVPNRYWRILITDWADRTGTPGATIFWVSQPFTAFSDETYTLHLSDDFAEIWLPQ